MLVTAIITLLIANFFNLESISTSGSAGFLLIFAIVNLANYKLARQTKSVKWISLIGAVLCVTALVFLMVQQFSTNYTGAIVGLSVIVVSYLIEFIYKKSENPYK